MLLFGLASQDCRQTENQGDEITSYKAKSVYSAKYTTTSILKIPSDPLRWGRHKGQEGENFFQKLLTAEARQTCQDV